MGCLRVLCGEDSAPLPALLPAAAGAYVLSILIWHRKLLLQEDAGGEEDPGAAASGDPVRWSALSGMSSALKGLLAVRRW